ncbi:SMI1/KNR4 family protein [Flavobacterium oreochromis]|uniref:Knr4/Smi1-like domain-containing protein n=2 Tax=Flavobacterium TaxID=237 RepID=A0A246GG16_9FLAO|nr:SMI1/KNR4 family protein [Flavobacterium oreochromis]OWP79040.1 hypothetical protein BWG23_00410 [Flavobacterium oreochromis]OWP79746.1 hypothetical protein BWK62_00470 [Flavobacterium oreochromis]POR30816.1 hypothetical protein BWK58_00520 [Flavobacterium columnare]
MIGKFLKKIEEVGGIEITSSFSSKKEKNFDVVNYLALNNLKLPSNDIDFSLKYAFGQFNEDVVFNSISKIPVGCYDDGTIPVTFIYGWGSEGESLQETRDALLDQVNEKYFVFAEGNLGDYVLIDTIDGKIYYYFHEGTENKSIFLVANNFDEFIENLQINKNEKTEDDIEKESF